MNLKGNYKLFAHIRLTHTLAYDVERRYSNKISILAFIDVQSCTGSYRTVSERIRNNQYSFATQNNLINLTKY